MTTFVNRSGKVRDFVRTLCGCIAEACVALESRKFSFTQDRHPAGPLRSSGVARGSSLLATNLQAFERRLGLGMSMLAITLFFVVSLLFQARQSTRDVQQVGQAVANVLRSQCLDVLVQDGGIWTVTADLAQHIATVEPSLASFYSVSMQRMIRVLEDGDCRTMTSASVQTAWEAAALMPTVKLGAGAINVTIGFQANSLRDPMLPYLELLHEYGRESFWEIWGSPLSVLFFRLKRPLSSIQVHRSAAVLAAEIKCVEALRKRRHHLGTLRDRFTTEVSQLERLKQITASNFAYPEGTFDVRHRFFCNAESRIQVKRQAEEMVSTLQRREERMS